MRHVVLKDISNHSLGIYCHIYSLLFSKKKTAQNENGQKRSYLETTFALFMGNGDPMTALLIKFLAPFKAKSTISGHEQPSNETPNGTFIDPI